jgi:lipopolysaccharide export system protein LptC
MKANEILMRQDRAVYILMVLIASIGLLWSFWQHQHPDNAVVPKISGQTTATLPADKTIQVRHN